MSELLWTLSLLAQKHLSPAPSVVPPPKANIGASKDTNAQREHAHSLNKAVLVSLDATLTEFSTPRSGQSGTVQWVSSQSELSHPGSVSDALSPLQYQTLKRETTGYPDSSTALLDVTKPVKAEVTPATAQLENSFHIPADVAASMPLPELMASVSSTLVRPASGSQLYAQRLAAIRAGKTYTRLPVDSFQEVWQDATYHPQYEDWLALLAQEADAMARGQGSNRLTIMIGDSLSQWFPNDQLPSDRFWLNQGISGDTSAGVLRRLSLIEKTHPDVIHVMVGINDLRAGATDAELLANLQQIMHNLRQQHPAAQIYVHSLLPTRLPAIPNDRITGLNEAIAQTALNENVAYLDLQTTFADESGNLRLELTTDGLHLSRYGYALWQSAMRWFQLA